MVQEIPLSEATMEMKKGCAGKLRAICYDPARRCLRVVSGDVLEYSGVPQETTVCPPSLRVELFSGKLRRGIQRPAGALR
jgi:hypothetical protein